MVGTGRLSTPVEQRLLDALNALGIPATPQEPVGWVSGYCRSKYRCKCGEDWFDPDTEEFYEANSSSSEEECDYWYSGHYKYYVDIFVEPGLAIEVDDEETHSSALRMPWRKLSSMRGLTILKGAPLNYASTPE